MFNKNLAITILWLACTLNYLVVGENAFGKKDLNLGLLPKESLLIIELLQLILLYGVLKNYNRFKQVSIPVAISIVIIAIMLVVTVINGNHISFFFSGLRYYFSPLPLLLFAYTWIRSGRDYKPLLKQIFLISSIQVPIVIYQYFIALDADLGKRELYYDMLSGTMGGFATNLMTTITCFGIIYSMSRFLNKEGSRHLLMSVILLVPSLLSESKGVYVVLMFVGLYLIIAAKSSASKKLSILFVIGLMLTIITYGYNVFAFNSNSISLQYLVEYIGSESGGGRLSRIESIFYAITQLYESSNIILGFGVGLAKNNPLGPESDLNNFYVIRHSIDILITEVGIIGLVFILTLLIYWLVIFTRMSSSLNFMQHRNITTLAGASIILLLVAVIWDDIYHRIQFMYPFVIIVGSVAGLRANYYSLK